MGRFFFSNLICIISLCVSSSELCDVTNGAAVDTTDDAADITHTIVKIISPTID